MFCFDKVITQWYNFNGRLYMNYKVLYRKYRPDCFDNLIGQEVVKTILKNSIINNKISHAYIFSGPRGTGKTSTAKIFAKTINCLDNKNGDACGKCVNCQNIEGNTDIIEIDAASNNGVDQIREIINNIKLAPTMSKYKVYIIDEVHMLSQSAFNALLLTLEEPPSHVIFILATTNIESVPITILSRCQRFDFKKLLSDDIVGYLKNISKKEKINITDEALNEIAYISDGGMRDALSILDQMSKDDHKITESTIAKKLGSVSMKSIEKILMCMENNDVTGIISQIDEYRNTSLDYKLIIKKIIDIAVIKAKNIAKNNRFVRLNYDDYKNLVFELTDCLNNININVDAYALIELVLLKYVSKLEPEKHEKEVPENKKTSVDNGVILDDIEKFGELENVRIHNCFAGASKENKKVAKDNWARFIDETIDNNIKSLILDTDILMASKNIYVVLTPNHAVGEFNEAAEKISANFQETLHESIKLVGVDNARWKELSSKYINDKKNGILYEFINESTLNKKSEIEKIATNLFNSDKIEIQ